MNPQPTDYKSVALPIELYQQYFIFYTNYNILPSKKVVNLLKLSYHIKSIDKTIKLKNIFKYFIKINKKILS